MPQPPHVQGGQLCRGLSQSVSVHYVESVHYVHYGPSSAHVSPSSGFCRTVCQLRPRIPYGNFDVDLAALTTLEFQEKPQFCEHSHLVLDQVRGAGSGSVSPSGWVLAL